MGNIKLPTLKPRQVIRVLKRAGFFLHHVTGSHYYFKHPTKPDVRISVPYHSKPLKKGTISAIIKEAGMTLEEFLKFF